MSKKLIFFCNFFIFGAFLLLIFDKKSDKIVLSGAKIHKRGGKRVRYDSELSFLTDVFEKSRVHTKKLSIKEASVFFEERNGGGSFSSFLNSIRPTTVYKLKDSFECRYRLFLLPENEKGEVLIIGPYLSTGINQSRLLEIAEEKRLMPKEQRYLAEYYTSLPVIDDDSHLMIMLSSFCERIWGTPSFAVEEVEGEAYLPDAPLSKSMSDSEDSDTVINIRAMERRYAFENEMIRAVELGLSQSEFPFARVASGEYFEKRVADPLRNAKNYCIIMNTLLRKAAEKGGVHPIYLDRVSSDFALRLERSASVSDNTALMLEMFRSYCRLVRKHRLKGYSITVQKIILSIDADISENLSSGSLAEKHGISLGYLSSVFRKETGKTVSEYIRERRMEYARYLLGSTKLQIQTVAFNSGIMDVQYFSKLFKKSFGVTPSEYRLSVSK